MAGAEVVVDLANSPSFEDEAALQFFETSGQHLFVAEKKARIAHHVALSVIGADRLAASGYLRAKIAQEALIRASGIPYTIVRSAQFFEFLGGIAKAGAEGEAIHLSPAMVQPIASDDVAAAVAEHALGRPVNGMVEIAGPDRFALSDLVRRYLEAIGDPREVVSDPKALYFGAELEESSLVPAGEAWLGTQSFESWLARSHPRAAAATSPSASP
jgi:uncharacterized protein YbjT (DUF2867 family)